MANKERHWAKPGTTCAKPEMLLGKIWIAGRKAKSDLCKTKNVIRKTWSGLCETRIVVYKTGSDLKQTKNVVG